MKTEVPVAFAAAGTFSFSKITRVHFIDAGQGKVMHPCYSY
ncbi:hypothetical protein GEOBRER4_n0090 [Citrifermentans bremense]|uniref:Uncharacterized protein n=1 Tax=Citrifermentans bremense TaxID=60035 RepID=A0A7R7IY19_9BACT|nr:hypothetical protein GEOBRER4_n0090 [Citrifermentans bremense]